MPAGLLNDCRPVPPPGPLRSYFPTCLFPIPPCQTYSRPNIHSGTSLPRCIFVGSLTHHFSRSNYWTHQGGLQEVIGVLPSREQADMYVCISSLTLSTCSQFCRSIPSLLSTAALADLILFPLFLWTMPHHTSHKSGF